MGECYLGGFGGALCGRRCRSLRKIDGHRHRPMRTTVLIGAKSKPNGLVGEGCCGGATGPKALLALARVEKGRNTDVHVKGRFVVPEVRKANKKVSA